MAYDITNAMLHYGFGRGPDLGQIAQQRAQNALLQNEVSQIPTRNAMLDQTRQIQGAQIQRYTDQDQAAKVADAKDALFGALEAIHGSPTPRQATADAFGSPRVRAAGQFLGLPVDQIANPDPSVTDEQIRSRAGDILTMGGRKPQVTVVPKDATVLGANGQPVFTNQAPERAQDPLGQLTADFRNGLVTKEDYDARRALLTTPKGAPANMSDDAIKFAADTYRQTGKLPTALGRNPAMQAKVLERVASDAMATGDTAAAINARSSALRSYQDALTQQSKVEAASKGYMDTIERNLKSMEAIQGKVDTSGVPLLNKALRAWQQGVAGDKDVATYVTLLNSIQGEFAKMRTGSLGNVAASDQAMRDAHDILNKFMSEQGIAGAAAGIRQEGANRLAALAQVRSELMNNLGSSAPGTAPAAAPAPQAAPGGAVAPKRSLEDLLKQYGGP